MRAIAATLLASCSNPSSLPTPLPAPTAPPAAAAPRPAATTKTAETAAGCDPAIIVEDGRERGSVCSADAASRHLTVVDLRDAWTPSLFAAGPDG